MQTLLFQDWTTLSTTDSYNFVTQGADRWLDVDRFEDLVFFLDVQQNATGVDSFMNYQTAPVCEDAAFMNIARVPMLAATTRADAVLAAFAQVPISRFVRWRLSSDAANSLTFRIWIAAYSLH